MTSNDRLSPLDASFLYLETSAEPMHVGAVALLERSIPFARLRTTLGERLGGLPRYRQRPVRPLLDLAAPSWIDDVEFDPARHIHRVTLRGGSDERLRETIAELFARPLDPARPLWDTYLVDGLSGGRAAILCKVHHCMIDGVSGAQILELMTDAAEISTAPVVATSAGAPPPPGADDRSHPAWILDAVGEAFEGVRRTITAVGQATVLVGTPIEPLPFNGSLGSSRRIAWASFPLDDFLAMRGAAGCKVNDVVLAAITGALRRYLPSPFTGPGHSARALIPVNVRRLDEHLTLGNRVSNMLATLPIDVDDPLERLRRVVTEMRALKASGQQRAFDLVVAAIAACPTPVGALITRASGRWSLVNTVCTNVPGPREPRFILGRRVLEIHPLLPLAAGIGLGFAILSYAGRLSICVTADAALVPDADRVADALVSSFTELRTQLGVAAAAPAARRAAAARPAKAASTAPRELPNVAALMSRAVVTLAPADSLVHAWKVMRERRIRHLPVVESGRKIIGLVTHRDLLAATQSSLTFQREADRVRLLGHATVADVMETHLSTARSNEPAADAGLRMARYKIGCLPVVDNGRLVGILTKEDFLHWAAVRMGATAA